MGKRDRLGVVEARAERAARMRAVRSGPERCGASPAPPARAVWGTCEAKEGMSRVSE